MVENTNHPCYGLDCKDCTTCIFDVELFKDDDMNRCNNCIHLVKNYIDDDNLRFNACCDKCIVNYINASRPRIISFKVGPMLDIPKPKWCPKYKANKQYISYTELYDDTPKAEKKTMTYWEKKESLMKLPKRTEWDDIIEGEVYVIPKVLNNIRKVVRVVIKTDTLIRYSEIDEFGNEEKVCMTLNKSDIESVFITKLNKY